MDESDASIKFEDPLKMQKVIACQRTEDSCTDGRTDRQSKYYRASTNSP